MTNVSEKNLYIMSKQKFIFNKYFSKILPFISQRGKKYGKVRQATHDVVILRKKSHFACRIIRVRIHTHNI